jgi:hypothetical protein
MYRTGLTAGIAALQGTCMRLAQLGWNCDRLDLEEHAGIRDGYDPP